MLASDRQRELGRLSAGLLGGFVLSMAMAVALSIYYPHPDEISRLYAGGIFFGPMWIVAMCVASMARDGRCAWLRIGVPALGLILMNVVGMLAIS